MILSSTGLNCTSLYGVLCEDCHADFGCIRCRTIFVSCQQKQKLDRDFVEQFPFLQFLLFRSHWISFELGLLHTML